MAELVAVRQSDFSAGEFSPRALGRTDSPIYARALAQCRNMIIHPQGSMSRRPGFGHLGACKTVSAFANTERSSASGAFDLNDAVYASELKRWVAVGDANGTNPVIVYSDDDAVTWTAAGIIPTLNFNLYGVTWSGSLFVAVGAYDGSSKTTIFTSTDGNEWIDRSAALTGSPNLYDILWTDTNYITVGHPNASNNSSIFTSTNGITFTFRSSVANASMRGAAWNLAANTILCSGPGGGTSGNVYKSTDHGGNWGAIGLVPNFITEHVLYDGANFYLGGEHTTGNLDGAIYRGTGDGTWVQVYANGSGSTQIRSISTFGNYLIAVGESGLFVSSDDGGATWTTESDIEAITFNGVFQGNNILVIVGDDDTNDAQLFTLHVDTTGRDFIPFPGATGEPYMMELGHLYIRFWREGIRVESSPGTPLEVATPWNGREIKELQFAQANDVMYLTHPSYGPRKLTRDGEATFTLVDMLDPTTPASTYLLLDGPYLDENSTLTKIQPGGVSGSVTLTATVGTPFASTDVGRTVRLFQDPEWGWLVITAYTSSTVVTAFVMGENLAASDAVTRWALGSFSATTGYPSAVTFYQQRLMFGGTDNEPGTPKGSVTSDFERFSPTNFDDTVTDDNGLSFTLATKRLSRILWMVAGRQLVVGTRAGVYVVDGSQENAAITPQAVRARLTSAYDASAVDPTMVGEVVIYAQTGGRKIRGMAPGQQDVYALPDLTLMADHVTETGIVELAFGALPLSTVWAIRTDGRLIGMTIHQEAEAAGWHLHTMGGTLTGSSAPEVLSIAILPSDGFDQLYAIVRRTINGSTVEHVEAMQAHFDDTLTGVDLEDAWHLDSAIKYDGPSTTAISGLDHLEGESVKVFADGVMQADKTVSSGAITIATEASVVLCGYAFDSDVQVVPQRAAAFPGAYIRVIQTTVEVLETSGLKVGPDTSNLENLSLNTGLNTGDKKQSLKPGTAAEITRPQYVIRSTDALPASILSLTHHLEVVIQP